MVFKPLSYAIFGGGTTLLEKKNSMKNKRIIILKSSIQTALSKIFSIYCQPTQNWSKSQILFHKNGLNELYPDGQAVKGTCKWWVLVVRLVGMHSFYTVCNLCEGHTFTKHKKQQQSYRTNRVCQLTLALVMTKYHWIGEWHNLGFLQLGSATAQE